MIKNLNGNNRLIISHIADIDGMGSVILANKYFDKKLDYILCEVKDLKDVFSEDLSNYETIYVCDLSFTQDAFDLIKTNALEDKIKHFDHHESGISDNNPSYVNEVIKIGNKPTCGTELFYKYLLSLDDKLNLNFYKTFVEGVRANDTWDKTGNFELGHKLASIHAMVGPVSFIELINSFDDTKKFSIPKVFLDLVKSDEDKMNNYIDKEIKSLLITNYKDYKIGVSISEQYRSIIGDEICKRTNVDFAFIINFERNSVSLRCIRDDIDLGEICLDFHHDGGGHRKAAGFIIDAESIPKIKPFIDEYVDHLKMER